MRFIKIIILFAIALSPIYFVNADEVATRMQGKVLLQKDVHMAWYVNSGDMLRYRLGSSVDMLEVMQKLGLGISNKDFDSFDGAVPEKLAGKILIKVEDSGRAYYVHPIDFKMHFLGDPKNALFVLRELGTSINDDELEKIKTSTGENDIFYEVHSTALSESSEELVGPENLKKSTSTQETFYTNGIYLTASTFRNLDLDSFIERNKNSLLNAVVVDVAGFGLLSYKEGEINPDITAKIQQLKDAGFYFIARVVVLKNTELARISPLRSSSGAVWNGVWVDGSTREIKDYYADIPARLAKIGVDEIQLDYIRFPTESFSRQVPQTLEERTKIITDLVRIMYEKTQEEGIKLSIDVFGILAWNEKVDIRSLGQDVSELIKYVDYMSPMIYPSHFSQGFAGFVRHDDPYSIIKVSTDRFIKIIGEENKEKLRPWIQGFTYRAPNFSSDYMYAQVKAMRDVGVDDFLVWNAANKYTITHEMFSYLKPYDGEK